MKILLIGMIRLYQLTLSHIFSGWCRFEPSCSVYAVEAIRMHGCFKGAVMAALRVCRCHPFHSAGYDPVPPVWPRLKTRLRGRESDCDCMHINSTAAHRS